MSRARPFDRLADVVERESRGKATPRDKRRLEADLDAWADALRREIGRVTEDLDRRWREVAAADAAGMDPGELAALRVDHAEWALRARSFRARLMDRLADVDRRRAQQLHQRLRIVADRIHNGELEGAVEEDDVDELGALLDQLDEVDPLPETAEAV